MRLALLAALLIVSGCTYDIFDERDDVGRFRIDDVVGVYTGQRTFSAPGQPARSVPATTTISREGDGTALIRIEFDGLVDEYIGSYSPSGFYVNGEVVGGTYTFSWAADGDGFITGEAFAPEFDDRRRFTGRLTEDHFDLFVRSLDGSIRDDLRTSR